MVDCEGGSELLPARLEVGAEDARPFLSLMTAGEFLPPRVGCVQREASQHRPRFSQLRHHCASRPAALRTPSWPSRWLAQPSPAYRSAEEGRTRSPMGPLRACLPLLRAAPASFPSDMPTSSSMCALPAPLAALPPARPPRCMRPAGPAEPLPLAWFEPLLLPWRGSALARRAAAAGVAIAHGWCARG